MISRIFDAAGSILLAAGGTMLAAIPRPDLTLGGSAIALSGLILTDLSFKGRLGVNWLMDKCGLTTGTALGTLGLGACAFLGGGEVIDIIKRGQELNPYEPGYLKVLANAIPYAAASAMSFKHIRKWLENPENDKSVTDAYRQMRDKVEEATGKSADQLSEADIDAIMQQDRRWLRRFDKSTVDATQLGLFALGHAMMSGYGALAGNSAREIGLLLFSGALASMVALATRPGRHVAGRFGLATSVQMRARADLHTPVGDSINYEYFESMKQLGEAVARDMNIDAKAYGELLMSRIQQQVQQESPALRS